MKTTSKLIVILALIALVLAGCAGLEPLFVGFATPTPPIQLDAGGLLPTSGPEEMFSPNSEGDPLKILMDRGAALWREGKLEAALATADEAVALAPDAPRPLELRAEIYLELGDAEAALADLERAETLGMASIRGFYHLTFLYDDRGAYEEAIEAGTQALHYAEGWDPRPEPEFFGYLYRDLADIRLKAGDTAGAIVDASRAIEGAERYAPSDAILILYRAYVIQAQAKRAQGDVAGAIADLESALRMNPWEYDLYSELNTWRHTLVATQAAFGEDPEITLARLNATLETQPTNPEILYERGMVYLTRAQIGGDSQDWMAALADFNAAIEADPTFAPAYHRRAVVRATQILMPAYGVEQATGGLNLDTLMAVGEVSGAKVNILLGDTTVSISEGNVTVTDHVTGESVVQPLEDWLAGLEDADAQAAAGILLVQADLSQALTLDPELAEAVHDLAVFNFLRAIPGIAGIQWGEMPTEEEKSLVRDAAAGFDQAVSLRPDWQQARFNRALANVILAPFAFLIGDALAEELSQNAVADADWLIERGSENCWVYYVRGGARVVMINLGLEDTESVQYQIYQDWERFAELVPPDVNQDNLFTQAVSQVQFSSWDAANAYPSPALLVASGEMDVTDDGTFYVNDEYGIRLAVPELDMPGSTQAVAVDGGPLWLGIQNGFEKYDFLILEPDLGRSDLEQWLRNTFLAVEPDATLVDVPLTTQYGQALLYTLGTEGEAGEGMLAVLQVGSRVYCFSYTLPNSRDTAWFPSADQPMDLLLGRFILGLEIDGVAFNSDLAGMHPRLLSELADTARVSGDYQKAVDLYRQALVTDPQNGAALNNLAWTLAYHLDQDLEQALEYALAAVALDRDAASLDTLALVYHKLGMYDEAVQNYSEALTLDPDWADYYADCYLRRGDAYAALGQNSAAIQDYETYLEKEPESTMREEIETKITALGGRRWKSRSQR